MPILQVGNRLIVKYPGVITISAPDRAVVALANQKGRLSSVLACSMELKAPHVRGVLWGECICVLPILRSIVCQICDPRPSILDLSYVEQRDEGKWFARVKPQEEVLHSVVVVLVDVKQRQSFAADGCVSSEFIRNIEDLPVVCGAIESWRYLLQ